MQPARLGARCIFVAASALLGALVLAQSSRAQAVLETSQQTNERIKTLSASAKPSAGEYIIGRGDLLAVEVFDVAELTRDVRVSQTGAVGLPLLPVRLQMAGLTEIQAQQKIAEVLEANGLVSHPRVNVSVKERKSQPITVVGAVAKPTVYHADHPTTLLEVLAEAGGIAPDAGDSVIISRVDQSEENGSLLTESETPNTNSSSEPPHLANTITVNLNNLLETGDTKNNIMLQGGDVVTIPHAGIVYVLGAVARPGGFVVSNDRAQLSTLKALALAGGLTATAKRHQAVIIRKDAGGTQHQVTVDLAKVLHQETEDVRLQPSDVLYVPQSNSRMALLRAAEIGLGIGTATAIFRVAQRN